MWEKGPFNENKPWGKAGVPVQKDNIPKSRERYAAFKAAQEGRATPEQMVLLAECDRLICQVIEERDADQ